MQAKHVKCKILPQALVVVGDNTPVVEPSTLVEILGFSDLYKINNMSKVEIRELIAQIENFCREFGTEVDVPIKHYFSKGVCGREMSPAKGSLIVGKIHKYENLNILSQGEVTVLSVDGIKRVKAPYTFVASEGAKRVILTHSDVIWTTILGTHERDIAKIEADFVAEDYSDVYLASDRSFDQVLDVLCISAEEMTFISENESDQIPFPEYVTSVEIADSLIHGKGIFSKQAFVSGDVIAPARLSGKCTPAGRYSNHSAASNATMVTIENGDTYLMALTDIQSNVEILTDYYFNYINTRGQLCQW